MKNLNFKAMLPHLVAIVVFLVVTVIFCKPALEPGVVLQQSDVTAVESMKHQSDLYREQHGVYPLWITSMFSGMPAYNVIFEGPLSPFTYLDKAFQFWLPKPLNFFFLCCISFYIFCMCVKVRPYVAIFASLAFAFSTYNPILVVAGHDTKLLAMAYAPALIGALVLLFEKQYLKGFMLSALFATLHLQQNHQQVSYYVFLIVVLMTLSYLIRWVKSKEFVHAGKALLLAVVAAAMGVMINAVLIFPVYDYAKDSKRGGQLVMDNNIDLKSNNVQQNKTTGLSREYAFQWSNDKIESLTIMFPGIAGYGRQVSERNGEYSIFPELTDQSAVANYLLEKQNFPEAEAEKFVRGMYADIYWGGKPFTSGPAYVGAVICVLFFLGMFMLNNKHKWWILSASLLAILMGMGKYLPGINNFLFDYLPLYNKFRTPEMALLITEILFPILAVLTVQKVLDGDQASNWKNFKLGAIATGTVFVFVTILYFSLSYTNENPQRTKAINALFSVPMDSTANSKYQIINDQFAPERDNQFYEKILQESKGNISIAKGIFTALQHDRKAFFGADIMRALIFSLLTLALLGLTIKGKINSMTMLLILPVLVLADLLPIGMHYVNENSFDDAEKYSAKEFSPSAADTQILKDTDPNFRVFDMTGGDPFQDSKPSYFHKSIGGYHPAKIGIYDDLATHQLSGKVNPSVLNMLNAKYIVQRTADGSNANAIQNPGALGNCWFVKGVKFVNGPVQEMKALDNFDPGDTAVMDEQFKAMIGAFSPADSGASIRQTKFDNMAIQYESNSTTANLAVFSEIFYKDWYASIDGKAVPVAKANYVLRALVIPAGKHTIDFKFDPPVFKVSNTISLVTNWLLFAMLVAFTVYAIKGYGNKTTTDAG